MSTVPDAVVRIERLRSARIARLRDLGVAALGQPEGIATARRRLAEILLIAKPGDPIAADLRERIDLAEHYGQFRPGQQFTDGLEHGARGPQMVVVPHGAYRMGAGADDTRSEEHTSELQSLMRISYAVFCLKKKKKNMKKTKERRKTTIEK